MLYYPVNKQFCLALSAVKDSLLSQWVTRANPIFFINEISNFGSAMITTSVSVKLARKLHFFVAFGKFLLFT